MFLLFFGSDDFNDVWKESLRFVQTQTCLIEQIVTGDKLFHFHFSLLFYNFSGRSHARTAVQAETVWCRTDGRAHPRVITCRVCLKRSAEKSASSLICTEAKSTAG